MDLSICHTGITDAGVAHLAKLEYLTTLDMRGCRNVTANCIDILSNANSDICELRVDVCADVAMEKIGRSSLLLSDLWVGCESSCDSCVASDFGIDGLVNAHNSIVRLGIVGEHCISVNGLIKLVNRFKDLVWLVIDSENKIQDARREAEAALID